MAESEFEITFKMLKQIFMDINGDREPDADELKFLMNKTTMAIEELHKRIAERIDSLN